MMITYLILPWLTTYLQLNRFYNSVFKHCVFVKINNNNNNNNNNDDVVDTVHDGYEALVVLPNVNCGIL